MPGSLGQMFAGVTTSPSREFIAELVRPHHNRIVLPCVGRWGVALAAVDRGAKPDTIHASDLSLFSTIIGYLADPRHSLDELELHPPDDLARFTAAARDQFDLAAGLLMVINWLSTPPRNAYISEWRREVWTNAASFRDKVADGLRTQNEKLAGVRYDLADVRAVAGELAACAEHATFAYVNLPGYRGGYTKLYGAAEDTIWTSRLAAAEFDPDEALPLLARLTDSPADVFAYVHHGDEQMPDGWVKHAAIPVGPGRTDYLIGNRDHQARMIAPHGRAGAARTWPLFDDEEITPHSRIEFVDVDRPTGLHYRDLLVHRLGGVKSETYGLMLIDGRVTTSFGLHRRDLLLGRTNYIGEVYGITITSARYARLGKLFMLALTSGEFLQWLLLTYPSTHINPPRGIQTASPTRHHEGKTDRGVLRLVRRVPLKGGGFQLLYRGEFRDDTFAQVMARWHERFGHVSRSRAA